MKLKAIPGTLNILRSDLASSSEKPMKLKFLRIFLRNIIQMCKIYMALILESLKSHLNQIIS